MGLLVFKGVTDSLLNSAGFKEDSVREFIINPILTRLGYLPTGANTVSLSKTLKNPFIYAGTKKYPVLTIPDYTLECDGKPVFILDAKSPAEDIDDIKHVQQAYSYAIHPEIRCREFGLCNGRYLSIFNTDNPDPIFKIGFNEIETRWKEVYKFLSPENLRNPKLRKYSPDYGSMLQKLGWAPDTKFTYLGIKFDLIAKVSDDLFSGGVNVMFADEYYCASFDFSPELLPQIAAGLPIQLKNAFLDAFKASPFQASVELSIDLDLEAKFGTTTIGATESFVPLVITRIISARFDPSPLKHYPTDRPNHAFRLRKMFDPNLSQGQ